MTQGIEFPNTKTPKQQRPQLRVKGVETPNPPIGQSLDFGKEIQVPDMTDEQFAEVKRAQQETFQAIAEANKAQAEATIADLKAKGYSDSGQELGGLASEIVNTLGILQKRKAEVAKTREKIRRNKLERIREEKQNAGRAALQQKYSEFQQKVREKGLEEGVDYLRREGSAVLQEFRDTLKPEQFEQLQKDFHSTLNEAEQDLTKRQVEMSRQQRDRKVSIAQAEIKGQLGGHLAGLEKIRDPEKAAEKANEIRQKASQIARDVSEDPQVVQRALVPALKKIAEAESASRAATVEANKQIAAINSYANSVQPDWEAYNNGKISRAEFNRRRFSKARKHNVTDLVGKFGITDEEARQKVIEEKQQNQKIRELQRSKNTTVSDLQVQEFENAQYGRLIYEHYRGNKDVRAALKEASEGDVNKVFADTTINFVKEFEQDVEEYNNLKEEALQIAGEVTQTEIDNKQLLFGEFVPEPKYDSESNRFRIPDNQEAIERIANKQNVSKEKVRQLIDTLKKRQDLNLRKAARLKEKWSRYNLNVADPTDDSQLAEKEAALQPLRDELRRQPNPNPEDKPMRGADIPNPREGDTAKPGTPTVSSLATDENGVFVRPFAKQRQDEITVTSEYGVRQGPDGGQEIHNGVDYAAPSGTEVKTVQGGKVMYVKEIDGFGKTVGIKTPDGTVEQYSHLSDYNVQQGQEIAPGTSIGTVGRTGNVRGNGSIVHVQIWKGDPVWGGRQTQHANTMNPADYLRMVKQKHAEPRGTGPPPSQKISGGDAVFTDKNDGKKRHVTEQHNNGNPIRGTDKAATTKSAYPNKNELNWTYGYETLSRDKDFARKLNKVANELGIPGQWLADIIAWETDGTFRTDIQSYDPSVNSLGLIQFTEGTAQDMGYSLQELSNMSRVEQLDVVKEYISQFKNRIRSVEDLVAGIYGGPGRIDRTSWRTNSSHFRTYLEKIGSHVGREYNYQLRRRRKQSFQRIHHEQKDGCPQCNQMMRHAGFITPHYEV